MLTTHRNDKWLRLLTDPSKSVGTSYRHEWNELTQEHDNTKRVQTYYPPCVIFPGPQGRTRPRSSIVGPGWVGSAPPDLPGPHGPTELRSDLCSNEWTWGLQPLSSFSEAVGSTLRCIMSTETIAMTAANSSVQAHAQTHTRTVHF